MRYAQYVALLIGRYLVSIRKGGMASVTKSLQKKIITGWLLCALVNVFGVLTGSEGGWVLVGRMLIRDANALLCVISFLLYQKEIRREARFLFLNFSIFFFNGGLSGSFCELTKKCLFPNDPWMDLYYYQYHTQLYFLFLALVAVYLVIDLVLAHSAVSRSYISTLGTCWQRMGIFILPLFLESGLLAHYNRYPGLQGNSFC